jgi:hypothetical protein
MRLRLGFRWPSVITGFYNQAGQGWTERRQEPALVAGEHLTG